MSLEYGVVSTPAIIVLGGVGLAGCLLWYAVAGAVVVVVAIMMTV